MSVVVKEGSRVVVQDVQKAMPAKESPAAKIAGLIADVEVKHEKRVKSGDEIKERWLQAQELHRLGACGQEETPRAGRVRLTDPAVATLEISHATLESVVLNALKRFQLSPLTRLSLDELGLRHYVSDSVRLLVYQPITESLPERGIGQLNAYVCDRPFDFLQAWRTLQKRAFKRSTWQAWLLIGTGEAKGQMYALALEPGSDTIRAAGLVIRGPGLRRIEYPGSSERVSPWARANDIWSRSMSAMGPTAWQDMTTDRFEIVGCGRTGSMVANQLANLGCRSLGLIDPDLVETHNLDGSTGLSFDAIGRPKVEVVAGHLERTYPWVSVTATPYAVGSFEGIDRIKRADVVIASVDNLASFLQTEAVCKLYGKTLVTIGTRLQRDEMGYDVTADIGMFFGGTVGCTLCMGERPANLRIAIKRITGLPEPPQFAFADARRGDFRQERAGSLLSINSTAVGMAMHAIQSAYGGGAGLWKRSYTMRLHFDANAHPQVETSSRNRDFPTARCLCACTNAGDLGLRSLGRLVGWIGGRAS